MPAIVVSRCQDVLAANPIARALSPGFTPGTNFLRYHNDLNIARVGVNYRFGWGGPVATQY